MNKIIIIVISAFLFSCNQKNKIKNRITEKPTICILGGTPSTKEVLELVPDSIKNSYNFISFNRPGYGGTENSTFTKEKLIKLAKDAGLKENDFGIIGISGGAPLAILIASELKLKHLGVVCGMVTGDAYFKHADSTITKNIMEAAIKPYQDFDKTVATFPNIKAIVDQAGAKNEKTAIRACYDELNYILSKEFSKSLTDKSITIDWWHAENDKNVTLQSAKEFLKDYKNSNLNIIPNADHNINSIEYIGKIIRSWE